MIFKEINITINKLSALSGMIQSTVENLMKSKTRNLKLKILHKIAIYLGMTDSKLLDFSEMNETDFDYE
ncbi:helix-turn-helix domain-containing protein [Paraclostridium sordellii]|uniref:helix-turn-helix domain-containing protein n=1 Tax=Paraclostridium sordellii TaxID=1505 RepID=UPI0021BB96FA|nr:helix-turn-helix transcriptional regulator [Paeniclostridium sordellii]